MASSSSLSSFSGAALLAVLLFLSSKAWSHPTHKHRRHPWESMQNLSGCRQGDRQPCLTLLKQYLHHFGYLRGSPGNFSDDFDHQLESALVAYQNFFNLNATGTIDASTLALITKPRCGVADAVDGTPSRQFRGRNLYAYFPGAPTWPLSSRDLTYAFTHPADVTTDIRDLFARAFAKWSDVTSFSFSEASSGGQPDITVGFYSGDHGDGVQPAFDGPGGVLAHSFAPTDGRLHVDEDEEWVVAGDVTQSSSPNAMDLESVMVHEIGHILGLDHSSVQEAVMFPTIGPRTRKVELADDDISGIQSLYGSK